VTQLYNTRRSALTLRGALRVVDCESVELLDVSRVLFTLQVATHRKCVLRYLNMINLYTIKLLLNDGVHATLYASYSVFQHSKINYLMVIILYFKTTDKT